jgi:glycosyltransferase involved in cell wall biosynthesis
MRVAIVAPHFPEYALRYAAALSRLCEVLVCVDAAQLADEYDGRGAAATGSALVRLERFKTPRDLLGMWCAIRRFRPDVVHLQEAAGPRRALFLLFAALALRRSAVIALTVHDPEPHPGRDQAAARATAPVGALVRRLARVIVVHGAYCEAVVRRRFLRPSQTLVRSEHGLILEPPLPAPPPPAPPVRLCFFGRMEAYKGLETLLRAAESLHAEGLAFELWIGGRGPELDRLQDRLASLPEITVRNAFIPSAEVVAAIQAADCVLLPYLSATQSGVLAAAFAGRRFVIASRAGGLPDVVEDLRNGLLVPPGDPLALAEAIRAAARDPSLRERLRAGAAATAAGRLDWDRIAHEMHAAFERAAS